MSRWETQRKPWNKAPGWRGETAEEQKGSLLCNGPLVVYSSRLWQRRSFPSAVMGMRHTSSVRTGLLMRAFMGWYPWGCRPCSLRSPSFSCGAARLTRRPQPPWPLSSRLPDFGPFFVALVIPGAGLVDPGQRVTREAFVPAPLLTAAVTCLSAAVGWYLARSGDTAAERALR
jgi:hypothetical protein